MKNIIMKSYLPSVNPLLHVLVLVALVSCGDYISQYSENDGAYYDPKVDNLPNYIEVTSENKLGSTYQYGYDSSPYSADENVSAEDNGSDSIVKRVQQNKEKQQNRYQEWGNKENSDWGKYTGTKVYINNYYGSYWRYPYHSWYYPYYYNPYGVSFGFGWSYSRWDRYYDPYWGWSYYPYYAPYPYYGYRKVYYRSVPKYKSRDEDYIDRSGKYNGNSNNEYNSNVTRYKSRNDYRSSSSVNSSISNSSSSSGNYSRTARTSGSGFRR